MAKTYDEIYCAAVEANIPQLQELLSTPQGKNALRERIVVDESGDWDSSDFTVLFSILNQMREEPNYAVLDALVAGGANFNDVVYLRNRQMTVERPLLEYTAFAWKNAKLTEYLLKKGADPNKAKINRHADGKIDRTALLYYAISEMKGSHTMELLLKYGAEPDQCSEIYNRQLGVYQYLPPLYYSMIHKGDYDKTVVLFRYGASPQCGIDLGKGISHNTNFKKYIDIYHPPLKQILVRAFEAAQQNPAKPKKAPPAAKRAPVSDSEIRERKQSGTYDHKLNSGYKTTSMRRCYGKFTAYCVGNFGFIALALFICTLIVSKSDSETAGTLFLLGLIFALPVTLIFLHVHKKAKARGQDGVMLQLVKDGVLMMGATVLIMSLILIPFAIKLTSSIQWEERKTESGTTVRVKKTGDGTYEDAHGRQYTTKD